MKTNFYKNNLTANKYFKILEYKKKFSKRFLLKNFGLFAGDKTVYRFLLLFEILSKVKNIKGDIIEFGVWNGNNLLTIKKITEYLNINKKLIGYDHFKGMPFSTNGNYFSGDKKIRFIYHYTDRFYFNSRTSEFEEIVASHRLRFQYNW